MYSAMISSVMLPLLVMTQLLVFHQRFLDVGSIDVFEPVCALINVAMLKPADGYDLLTHDYPVKICTSLSLHTPRMSSHIRLVIYPIGTVFRFYNPYLYRTHYVLASDLPLY